VGDEYLKVIAFRLEAFVRGGDTAARLGGDEFALLLENFAAVEDVTGASERILAIVNQPIEFGGREISVTASIGVALLDDQSTGEVLLRNADVAMYQSKQTGKNRATIFSEALFDTAFERLEVMADLRQALERRELSLFYQPLFSFQTTELVGFEALMRWNHPEKGFISPAVFIPVAEETGMIVELGAWALEEACQQLATWRQKYGSDVGMNVNVSPRQLQEARIIDDVQSAIVTSGVDPQWITLELTESAGLDDEVKRDRFHALRTIGCQIAADDFGTGFASYAALQQLPFTNVKIDRSLIIGLSANDPKAQAQVKSIIDMGHSLGLQITAEGIEDTRQADILTLLGADKAQGFLFGKPVPSAEAEEYIRTNATTRT
jgi:predicted signal transduction protein with EAL and GGDEF domain